MPAPKNNKNAIGNKGGRPELYKPEYHPKAAYRLCLLGATDKEMAEIFSINKATLNRWKKEHVEFSDSLTRGKTLADSEIAVSLFKRAKGYKHPETKFFVVKVGKDQEEIQERETIARYPPDTKAIAIWLSNRRNNWQERPMDKSKFPGGDNKPAVPQSTPFTIIDPATNKVEQLNIGEADD